mgnify:CR=1 FL=1
METIVLSSSSFSSYYCKKGGIDRKILDYDYVSPDTGLIDVTRSALRSLTQNLGIVGELITNAGGFLAWIVQGGFNLLNLPSKPLGVWIEGSFLSVAGGVLGFFKTKILGAFGAFAGGICTRIAGWVVQKSMGLLFFNWNVTDTEIKQQQEASITAFYGMVGSTLGGMLGQVVCGGVPGIAVAYFQPQLALMIKEELGEELFQEMMGYVNGFIFGSVSLLKQYVFLSVYKNARKTIKEAARNPAMRALLPDSWEQTIEYWGSPKSKPWSFNIEIENKIENIENVRDRALMENLYEEFVDSCGEAIIAFGSAMDAALI